METNQVCVDTDIVVDYLRGKGQLQHILPNLLSRYKISIAPISIYELYYGGYYSGKLKPVEDVLSVMSPMDWTLEDSKKAAQIHVALSKSGETLSVKDILIAAPCIVRSIPIVSRNILHFRRVPGLDLIDGARYV